MQQNSIALGELSVTEIKALIFDEMEKLRVAEHNIQVLRRELAGRNGQAPAAAASQEPEPADTEAAGG